MTPHVDTPRPPRPVAAAAPPAAPDQPATQAHEALADALRVSFWLLRAAIIVLLAYYLFLSGLVNVREQEKAVRIRFGRIVGEPGKQVLEPGGPYFALPFPIERVVIVPTSPQQIELTRQFWYELPPAEAGKTAAELAGKAGPLDPQKDGSLLTGDANIIHARWSVTYAVSDVVRYASRVADPNTARRLVLAAAEQGIVAAVAQLPSDSLMKPQNIDAARATAQAALDTMGTGLRIVTLSLHDAAYPLSVRTTAQAALNAESERAKLLEEAYEQRDSILGSAAGEAYPPLLTLINRYEAAAAHDGDPRLATELDRQLQQALTGLHITAAGHDYAIGGQVAELIHEAQTYRIQAVAELRIDAERLTSLLPQYRQNPSIVLNQLWQQTREQILTGDVETIYLPAGQTLLELNRNPAVGIEREKKRLTVEQTENQ
jgi:membrane protease subunit HflK